MPPKRAATPIFADCVFAIAGTFSDKSHVDITSLATSAASGATVMTTVSKKITHLITNQAEIDKNSAKVVKAITTGTIVLVTLDWIEDSLQKKKRLDVVSYTLSSATTSSSPTTPAATTTDTSTSADADADTKMDVDVKTTKKSKRKASDNDTVIDDSVEKKIKTLKVQAAKSSSSAKIRQPEVDRACTLPATYSVYVDSEVAWNARLNQTNIGQNNNKFYLIQLLKSTAGQYAVFAHWGRVGNSGQTSVDAYFDIYSAKSGFEKKFKDKTKNDWSNRDNFVKHSGKYHLLPPDDGDSDDEDATETKPKKKPEDEPPVPESKLHPKVQDLMRLIFNTEMMNRQMKELDYDADKMPLGKLAKSTILEGYTALKQIGEALSKPGAINNNLLSELSSHFYTVIPHSFGMRAPPIIKDAATLKKKLEMLESLGEIEVAQKLMKENKKIIADAYTVNPLDQQFESLKLNKFEPMDKDSERYKLIDQFVKNSHGSTHNYYDLVIEDVFDLDRQGEQERFDDTGFSKFHNRRLLWHGSRLTNFVGILSQGLRIAPPEAPVTGYMFDKGAYFADCVSKSANYCFTSHSNNTGLMLLCEVALGDMLELEQSDYNAKTRSEKAGKHSTKGCGLSYPDPKDDVIVDDNMRVQVGKLATDQKAGNGYRLQYNEFIVYNTSQVKMRYLIKMKFDYGKRRY
ncbi:Poly [ADP-ribose] polymerase 2 [Entomortierella chlamydospora]|uniref:Poly [ADP-ribose] polymerase n=1 Tax=Entomortierella chlamydospora TaxID=101097 RepID=A0A9P6MTU8_9FUNG|nr:Poly [ADP-ribose] polymerase 2 [Entomortierella chlamydospora]KAG0012614.1 Poly [ADP-ribose] polymerase 2 [Entomortierella chlamydospora]